ncbi:PAS domain-containing protein, partial [Deinococcus pimensis]|uniref:PAS domain-containing protein n=1 Tax=Deinococcus pimensis TaxID=309888 RepID=UPI0005EAEE86
MDFAAAVELLPDPFFLLTHDWRLRYANPAARTFVGWPSDLVPTADFWKEFPATVGTPFEAEFHRALREGVSAHFEAYYTPRDAWLEVRAFPCDGGLGVHYRDVTARRAELDARRLAEGRAAALYEVTARLARADTVEDVTHVILTDGLCALGAGRGAVSIVEDGGQYLRVLASRGYDDHLMDAWSRVPLTLATPAAQAVG